MQPEQDGSLGEQKLSAEDVRKLYDRHGPALVAYASTLVADASAAEDVVHGVFVRLLNGGAVMAAAPATYLYRAVRNQALNTRRNGRHEAQLDEHHVCFVHRGGNREAALALQQALRDLPEKQREVVVMRIWDGMTLEEVAGATEVSLNTAASRYRYALEKLRERLQPLPKRIQTGEDDG
jgi:RNA polymerase sigma-70 factor, ECF subfamily